ncbi:MAG: ComEC/Rec2 family competence protein [Opitutaceae bacterium]
MPPNILKPTRAPALYLLPGMIVGLLMARQFDFNSTLSFVGVIALIISIWVSRSREKAVTWFAMFFIGTCLIFWAYGHTRFPAKPSAESLTRPEREATLIIDIERVFQQTALFRNTSGIARIHEASSTSPAQERAQVYFRLSIPKEGEFTLQRGQQLQVTGVLYPILIEPSEDSFDAYLKDIGIHYSFERTSDLVVLKPPSAFDRFCMHMNERFDEYLRLGAPADTRITNIYVAMLLGKKASLTDEQTDRFRMSGTMHFFAISGLHIGVIATVIAQCLLILRVPRRYRPWIGLPLLYLYVETTGAPPSAIRAFLMATCFWVSFAIMRQRSPLSALATSAVAVLLIAPEQLWSLGFQLSYTVVLSILLFGLPLNEVLVQRFRPYQLLPEMNWKVWHRSVIWATEHVLLLFSISFAAWLASAPLSAGLFGFMAPGAIILNMLLVSLAALVITTGVLSISLATIGLGVLTEFINHCAWIGISIMDLLVQATLQIPGCTLKCEAFPKSISYLAIVGFLGILLWMHQDRTRFTTRALLIAPTFIGLLLMTGYILK